MGTVSLGLRLVLAGVLATAAVGKLTDRAGARQALRRFGVPAALASPLTIALPAGELAIAVALIAPATAWWGALGALALLTCFCVAIAASLRRGNTPPCHCFGRLHSTPAGPAALARTGTLAALAALLLATARTDRGPDALGWIRSMSRVDAIELALALSILAAGLAAGAMFAQLVAQNGRLSLRVEALEAQLNAAAGAAPAAPAAPAELAVGADAPPFTLGDVDGTQVTLDELRAPSNPVLLVFSDPDCGPCRALRPDLMSWQREHAARLTLTIVSRGTHERNSFDGSDGPRPRVLLQRDREIAHAYGAHATPTAILVAADGTIASPPTLGARAIAELVARTARPPAAPGGTPNGSHDGVRRTTHPPRPLASVTPATSPAGPRPSPAAPSS